MRKRLPDKRKRQLGAKAEMKTRHAFSLLVVLVVLVNGSDLIVSNCACPRIHEVTTKDNDQKSVNRVRL